jgi:hypothetical protein
MLRLPDQPDSAGSAALDLDSLGDLLAYDPGPSTTLPRTVFLERALHRLEAGDSVLTRKDGAKLAECWWLSPVDRPFEPHATTDQKALSTASALLIHDPYFASPQGSDRGLGILDRLGSTVRGISPGALTYLAVPDDDVGLLEALLEAGAIRADDMTRMERVLEDEAERLASDSPDTKVPRRALGLVGMALADLLPKVGEASIPWPV